MINSFKFAGRDPKELTAEQVAQMRERLAQRGLDVGDASDEDIRNGLQMQAEMFRDAAPMTAAQAATVILDGVRAGEWRILVGDDAHTLDALVRQVPAEAYDDSFAERLRDGHVFDFTR